jgi:cytochrome b
MLSRDITIGTGGDGPPATIKVWDPFIRAFHWSVVALFATAYVTGDEIQRVHEAAGYTIAGLLVARVLWGFVGPRHARFSDFVRSPHDVLGYLRDIVLFRARRYIGHNPAGGVMVVALIGMLGATAVTGYLMTTDAYWGSEAMEDVHGALANLTLAMAIVHVVGVLVASFEHRENLVKAMLTGRKRASDPSP